MLKIFDLSAKWLIVVFKKKSNVDFLYLCYYVYLVLFNPSVTARVKISQNVDVLAKVYRVHLKVEHCQTLPVVSTHVCTFTGQNESTVFDW